MEASAQHVELEPEPREWQTRSLWAATRMWCGAVAFFFVSFLFAFFYLRELNTDGQWTVGNVNPPGGFGVAIVGLLILSAILIYLGSRRPADTLSTGIVAIVTGLVAVILQFVEYANLGFGPASGGYASVFIGWTATYALAALCGVWWMETQVATVWRAQRNDWQDVDEELVRAGVDACAFFWAFFVAIGVIAYIVLYLV
jgi:heme/copper-type cytochrome/quinol oxidase subunit 3